MSVTVSRVRPEEWLLLKTVRLAALQDAPYAFGSRYEDMVVKPDTHWQETAQDRATSSTSCTFLARDADGNGIGMAGGYQDEQFPELVHLVAMWVAPEWRGHGLAAQIVTTVYDWARSGSCTDFLAYVTTGNDRALRFYEKQGFVRQPDDAPRPGLHATECDILMKRQIIRS